MAQAHVVYTNAAESVTFKGSLFQGKKFWLSRTVPQRTHISEQITVSLALGIAFTIMVV